jgi:hypothetical protein
MRGMRSSRRRANNHYLEMLAHPQRAVPPPREGLAVVHAKKPTVAYYRLLYDAVGRNYDWTSRKKLSAAELAALLNDPRLEVHVLMADGVPAGFAELDRRVEGEIELAQFGLLPEFVGQGLGGGTSSSGLSTRRGATAPSASGCTPTPRTTRLLCRTTWRRASPSTEKRSRTRAETMPVPVKLAHQCSVAEIAPELPARLKLDKKRGRHRDRAKGEGQWHKPTNEQRNLASRRV